MRRADARIRVRCRHARGDEGFSIIEALVAMTLLAVTLLTVERGSVTVMQAASVANEHSVATSLVAGDIAQVVALPFTDLEKGLNPAAETLTSDSNITTAVVGGVTSYVFKLNGATIPTSNTSSAETSLVPHITTVTAGIRYAVATYPTLNPATPGLVTVTVVVSWMAPTGGTDRVVGQTLIAAP